MQARRQWAGGRHGESILVRTATINDAAAIAKIHNQGIRARIATSETGECTPEERRSWLAARDERHPEVGVWMDALIVERLIRANLT